MKVKLIYKKGIVYTELPDDWYNRDRIYIPKRDYPSVSTSDISFPVVNEHTFQHSSFEMINGENHKILREI
jgi:hypothetical protein